MKKKKKREVGTGWPAFGLPELTARAYCVALSLTPPGERRHRRALRAINRLVAGARKA